MRPLAFLCDFDGTVSPTDVGAALVARYTTDPARVAALVDAWRAGTIGARAITAGECATLRVGAAEAQAFALGFALDPGFAPFARAARDRGEHVEIASEGFGFYVRALLARAGLEDLPWSANEARFEDDRVVAEFPHLADDAPGCPGCGNCKARRVDRLRAAGWRVVVVGDGFSDRCAADRADVVLARGALLAWARERGLAARPFADFADVARQAGELSARGGAVPTRRAAGRIEG